MARVRKSRIKKLSLLCSMTGNSGLILMDTRGGVNTDTRVASLDLPSPSTLDSWQEYIPPSSLLTFLRRDIFRHSSMDIRVETRVELDFVTILNRILKFLIFNLNQSVWLWIIFFLVIKVYCKNFSTIEHQEPCQELLGPPCKKLDLLRTRFLICPEII